MTSPAPSFEEKVSTFRSLHQSGTFLMPNPWDVGSARYLQSRGFKALATTSAGFAASLGRPDQAITRDELVGHVSALSAATRVPLNVDAENCFSDDLAGIATTVRMLAEAGAAGCSIEDYDPRAGRLYDFSHATERVAAAAAEAKTQGIVLTARCENFIRRNPDLGDTISRLAAFVEAGAEVIYPTGLVDVDDIAAVAAAISSPMNILTMPNAPSVEVLTGLGVRRISTGGAMAWAALAGLGAAVDRLLDAGVYDFATGPFEARPLSREARDKMLSPDA